MIMEVVGAVPQGMTEIEVDQVTETEVIIIVVAAEEDMEEEGIPMEALEASPTVKLLSHVFSS